MADAGSAPKMTVSKLMFATCQILLKFFGTNNIVGNSDYQYLFTIDLDQISFDKKKKFSITFDRTIRDLSNDALDHITVPRDLEFDWNYDAVGRLATTVSEFAYDDELHVYVLVLKSNTWVLKLFFERYDCLLIPSTLYIPIFERDARSQLPCSVSAISHKYNLSYVLPFQERFFSGLLLTSHESKKDEYQKSIEDQSTCLSFLKAQQRLAFAQVELFDCDMVVEIGKHVIAKLFQSHILIDKITISRILIEEDNVAIAVEEEKERIHKEERARRYHEDHRYKTALCRHWLRQSCMKGDKCSYAHGITDMMVDPRSLSPDPLYKTQMCRNFLRKVYCPYGHKCKFAHGKQDFIQLCGRC